MVEVGFNYVGGAEHAKERYEKNNNEDLFYIRLDKNDISLSLDDAEDIAYRLLKMIDQIKYVTR